MFYPLRIIIRAFSSSKRYYIIGKLMYSWIVTHLRIIVRCEWNTFWRECIACNDAGLYFLLWKISPTVEQGIRGVMVFYHGLQDILSGWAMKNSLRTSGGASKKCKGKN
jgi:hypothetical protein